MLQVKKLSHGVMMGVCLGLAITGAADAAEQFTSAPIETADDGTDPRITDPTGGDLTPNALDDPRTGKSKRLAKSPFDPRITDPTWIGEFGVR